MNRPVSCVIRALAIALCFILQGCGSSGSGAATQTVTPFSAPTDAPSLSAALTTSQPTVASDAYWECTVRDDNRRFDYQFISDGTGVETDLNNNGAESSFLWNATSASSATITVTNTGAQITLTDIQFTSRDAIRLVVNESIAIGCSRQTVNNQTTSPDQTPVINNTLVYDGLSYPLTHGFEEVFSFSPDVRNDTHRTYQFNVADAEFRLLQLLTGGANPLIIWRPDFATVWFRADIHSPGAENFQNATFEFESDDVDENGPAVAGKHFFNDASLGIDLDGINGIDNDANEFKDVVAGTIVITRNATSQATMSFDVVLEDGARVAGSFAGQFIQYEY